MSCLGEPGQRTAADRYDYRMAGWREGWDAATAAAAALIRDRDSAYYGRGSEALAAAIEAGEHEPYGGV